MVDYEKELKRLNPEQRRAVEQIEGPVMVVAGPGTGKTQILALRIANILKKTDTTPYSVLCLTFTEAGVKAMRARLSRFIGPDAYKVNINTFHGFANEIINQNQDRFAFDKDLIQVDDLNRLKIIKKILDEIVTEREEKKLEHYALTPFYNKHAKAKDIISAIQVLKKESITPEKLEERARELISELQDYSEGEVTSPRLLNKKDQKHLDKLNRLFELAEIYKRYQSELKDRGLYDYEDMIMFVIKQFENDSDLLSDYQEKYLYTLVDEYQDTNGAQNKIIELLGSFDKSPNIFVVGDDDQAIYRFQGANLGNILFFSDHFENVETIPTITNYRSNQLILDLAESLITNNQTRLVNYQQNLEKKLKAYSKEVDDESEVWEFNNSDEENVFIAKRIKELEKNGVNLQDIAVVYRKNAHGEDINEVLEKYDIETKLDSSRSIFEANSISNLLNYLKLIVLDELSNENFHSVLLSEYSDLNKVDVYKIIDFLRKQKLEPRELVVKVASSENYFEEVQLDLTQPEKIKHFFETIFKLHNASAGDRLDSFVIDALNESGILHFYSESSEDFESLIALKSFTDFVKLQVQLNSSISLKNFLKDLKTLEENYVKVSLPKNNQNKNAVNLLTAHSSKGLEFEYVFVVKATSNNWGSTRKFGEIVPKEFFGEIDEEISEKDLMLEDERRLFFVAITRAKKKVIFTYANEYLSNGSVSNANPSPFLSELDESKLKKFNVNDHDQYDLKKQDYVSILKPEVKQDYSSEEREYLLEQVSKFKLSPSSLNEYLESPEEFKLNRLIKIPQATNKYMAMGTAVHYALENLNKSLIKQDIFLSIDQLLFFFETKLKQEFFFDDEYQRTLDEGKLIIEGYYKEYIENGAYTVPIESEYNFYFDNVYLKLDNQDPIPLNGRIDKVEKLSEGSNEINVKVVDYKNSKPVSKNVILGNTQASNGRLWRQLVFYKLLGDLDNNFRPKKSFSKPKYIVTNAEIDFLRKNTSGKYKKESFEIKDKDVTVLSELIGEVMGRIRRLEFPEESGLV